MVSDRECYCPRGIQKADVHWQEQGRVLASHFPPLDLHFDVAKDHHGGQKSVKKSIKTEKFSLEPFLSISGINEVALQDLLRLGVVEFEMQPIPCCGLVSRWWWPDEVE